VRNFKFEFFKTFVIYHIHKPVILRRSSVTIESSLKLPKGHLLSSSVSSNDGHSPIVDISIPGWYGLFRRFVTCLPFQTWLWFSLEVWYERISATELFNSVSCSQIWFGNKWKIYMLKFILLNCLLKFLTLWGCWPNWVWNCFPLEKPNNKINPWSDKMVVIVETLLDFFLWFLIWFHVYFQSRTSGCEDWSWAGCNIWNIHQFNSFDSLIWMSLFHKQISTKFCTDLLTNSGKEGRFWT